MLRYRTGWSWSWSEIGPRSPWSVVREPLEPGGGPERLLVVLHEDPVVEQGDPRRLQELAGRVEPGAAEGDVVGLPLAGRARGVEQGRILAVDRPRLAVGVGLGLVGVEHLDLELAHQEDAAVAAVLAHAGGRVGRGPLDVELDVAELPLRLDRPGPRHRLQVAVGHLPPRGPALGRLPRVEARPVEQDDRILRRLRRDRGPPRARPPAASGRRMSCCLQRAAAVPVRTSSAARQARSPEVAIRQARPSRGEREGMGDGSPVGWRSVWGDAGHRRCSREGHRHRRRAAPSQGL